MMEATASTEPSAFGARYWPASVSTISPPAAGPATIAMPQTPASHDMATVCSEAGTTSGMAAFATAMMPLNKPIASRAATAQAKDGARPKSSWKTAHESRPTWMTGLRPRRSESAPR